MYVCNTFDLNKALNVKKVLQFHLNEYVVE